MKIIIKDHQKFKSFWITIFCTLAVIYILGVISTSETTLDKMSLEEREVMKQQALEYAQEVEND